MKRCDAALFLARLWQLGQATKYMIYLKSLQHSLSDRLVSTPLTSAHQCLNRLPFLLYHGLDAIVLKKTNCVLFDPRYSAPQVAIVCYVLIR